MVFGRETLDATSPNTNATAVVPARAIRSSVLSVSTGADEPYLKYSHAVGAAMATEYRMIPTMALVCMSLSPLSTAMATRGRSGLPDHVTEGLHHTDDVTRTDGSAKRRGERTRHRYGNARKCRQKPCCDNAASDDRRHEGAGNPCECTDGDHTFQQAPGTVVQAFLDFVRIILFRVDDGSSPGPERIESMIFIFFGQLDDGLDVCNASSEFYVFSATCRIRMLTLIRTSPSIFRASTISGARGGMDFGSLFGGSFLSVMGAISTCLGEAWPLKGLCSCVSYHESRQPA